MYDSTNVGDIPKRTAMAAGYVDGRYVTFGKLRAARPHVLAVSVSVNGSKSADVIDRETGDVGAKRAAEIINNAGAHTVYCNLSALGEVLRALAAVGDGLE